MAAKAKRERKQHIGFLARFSPKKSDYGKKSSFSLFYADFIFIQSKVFYPSFSHIR